MEKRILMRHVATDRHVVQVVAESREEAEEAITDEGGEIRFVTKCYEGFKVDGIIPSGTPKESDRLEGNGWKWTEYDS